MAEHDDRDRSDFSAAGYYAEEGPTPEQKTDEARRAWGLPEVTGAAGVIIAIGVGGLLAIPAVERFLSGSMEEAAGFALATGLTFIGGMALKFMSDFAGQKRTGG